MVVAELLNELKGLLSENQIKEGPVEGNPLGNSGNVVVYPRTEEEISMVLKYANEHGKKIIVEGRGTKRGFGGLVEKADILLSLAEYKGIIEHGVGDLTMTVKAGTPFQELQSYLETHGQKISLDPAWPEEATIGGIIAANESGPKRLGYGSARDLVIGLRVVYPDGSIIRTGGKVVKNVAGYDMNKLFIGSMGTLGVISEVTVKLRPIAKSERLVLIGFPERMYEGIRSFAVTILDSKLEPTALELLSPTIAEKLTGVKQYTLAMSFEDVESSVRYQEEAVKKLQPAETTLSILHQEEATRFWTSFSTLRKNALEGEEVRATVKIGVVNLDVVKVIKECQLLQDPNHVRMEAHGGVGHGLCYAHLEGASEDVASTIYQLRDAATQLGGYLIVKDLPFRLRQTVNVWGSNPSYYFLLEGIKKKVDPNGILNDKRFVGGM